MWNQPYFNQPPMMPQNPYGGYIFVPVTGPTSQTGAPNPTMPKMKKKNLRRQIKEAEDAIDALKQHTEWLRKNNSDKKDDKKDDKKSEDNLNVFQKSILLMLTVPFLTMCEIYAYKQMVKPG